MSDSDQLVPDSISITIAAQPQAGVVELVESLVFGTEGLKYQRLDVRAQLGRFNEPTYFHATVDSLLVGVYVMDRRDLLIDGKPVTGYYRGVLAVALQWQRRGVGKRITNAAMGWLAAKSHNEPIVSYGCIDKNNTRSLKLLGSVGAAVGPSLSMYMMYRQWPKVRCKLDAMEELHQASIHQLADIVYKDCGVRDVSPSPLKGLVLQDEKGTAICARVTPTRFRITRMGVVEKWTTAVFVTPFSVARKRFDPSDFRYVSFSNVLIRPGSESLWPDFVCTVLALHSCYFGAVYVDPTSNLYSQLNKSGLIGRLFHSSEGSINVVLQSFGTASSTVQGVDSADVATHLWPIDA